MTNCIFCKIISGEIKSEILFQDEDMIIIKDIHPQAKLHYLAIPKRHFSTLDKMEEVDVEMLGRVLYKVSNLQEMLGIKDGYRLIINQGENGRQTVMHLHIHILGGQKLSSF